MIAFDGSGIIGDGRSIVNAKGILNTAHHLCAELHKDINLQVLVPVKGEAARCQAGNDAGHVGIQGGFDAGEDGVVSVQEPNVAGEACEGRGDVEGG